MAEWEAGQYEGWDFYRVAQQLGGNEFQDISDEVPNEQGWHRAQDPEHERMATNQQVPWEKGHPGRSHSTSSTFGDRGIVKLLAPVIDFEAQSMFLMEIMQIWQRQALGGSNPRTVFGATRAQQ